MVNSKWKNRFFLFTIYHLLLFILPYTVPAMSRALVSKKSFVFVFGCVMALLLMAAVLLFVRTRSEAGVAANGQPHDRMAGFPKTFLWAWERPEQLDFIDPKETGVAFLARTIYLREGRVIERPRLQPLKVPPGTVLVAVVRIEAVRGAPALFTTSQREDVLRALIEAAHLPEVKALQIDFDARESEREFYRNMLIELRKRMPASMPLSITALASWCVDDNWLEGVPVDEAVPMLFRMGLDDERIRNYLKEGGAFRNPLCRLSSGVSTDEELKFAFARGARTYVFHTRAWTERDVRRAIERSRK